MTTIRSSTDFAHRDTILDEDPAEHSFVLQIIETSDRARTLF
jgi:hypothetical protein